MRIKKLLCVLMATVMLLGAFSVGFTGAAAEIDYDAQYRLLSQSLQNEHVRELTNYTVTNTTLDNGTEGFDQEARGFAYDHRVVARDNAAGDILKASNRFYYIAESLMSYKYGTGCYDASTLVNYISEKIKPYFASTAGSGEVIYEDFYGERYYPTAEEEAAYKKAVMDITAIGAEVTQSTLTSFGIYFMEMDDWSYYNVDTVLKYFMGNVLKINTGNWYHRFSFIVETSVDNILEECEGIESIGTSSLTLRTAVYQIDYQKEYNESMSKAYFSFARPSLEKVWENYAEEFGFNKTSDDLTKPVNGFPGLLRDGQASAYMIKVSYDTTTVPYLQQAAQKFDSYISTAYDASTNTKWDSQFVTWSDETVTNHADTPIILAYASDFGNNYSNAALKAVFGKRLGNMVTLVYLFKTSRSDPSRTVRGTATYTATAEKLDDIIYDLDALVSPKETETDNVKISNRVATVVSMFLNVGDLLGIQGEIDYSTLEDLIGKIIQHLVYSDSIINLLVEALYPMIVDLIQEYVINAIGGSIGSFVGNILDDIIDSNDLAIYPHELGERIEKDYPGKYTIAATILKNTQDNKWENVNFDGIVWGVDDVPADERSEYFLDALCAGLCGFTRLLVTFMCGDFEYNTGDYSGTSNIENQGNFGRYFDLKLMSGLSVFVVAQGLYTKLFIPLYRVLGLEEKDYMTSEAYHVSVAKNIRSCLKEAVRPIITWVNEYVAKKPFQTIMELVPNLVYFLSREGQVELKYASDWKKPGNFAISSNQKDAHRGFSQLQTYSLMDMFDNIHINLTVDGIVISVGSLKKLIGEKNLKLLNSLNALLNDVISLEYDTDQIASVNIACYSDDEGNVVLPTSTEYALNPSKYLNAHTVYYADASNTKLSLTKDDDHPFEHQNITYHAKTYYLPAVPEAKLISCGEVYKPTEYNTIKVDHPGLVFKFLLRYVISAVGYRYDQNLEDLPSLIECLGLDLSDELFNGLTLGDIIDNVMIHPDEAICALLELFYTNEYGDLYNHKAYTYPVENINYHETTLLNKTINPTLTYGADVKYSKYWTKEYANDFVSSLGPLVEDILIMFGLEGMEDGLGAYLENMLNEYVFNNDLVNDLFNMIYQLLAGLNESVGMDIEGLLDAVLDVNFTTITVARAVEKMMGYETPATRAIKAVNSWTELFDGGYTIDPITGEKTPIVQDVDLDWGIDTAEENGLSRGDAFLRTVSALLSPAAFALKFLFMDQNLEVLGLITLPAYAGYQYAFIGLLEALSCPDILTYEDYYKASLDTECGDANVIYYLFYPLLGLLDDVYEDPVDTILNLIPNLLFFISIGGLNDLINNLLHFAYVLLDILKPIINAYDLLDGLISNIDISGLNINLTIPLDVDVNSLVSDLLGTLVGDALTIEGVSIQLPYIDLYTLCVGTLEKFTSKEVRTTVHLNGAGGGELLTALLRIVFEVLFMEENHKALSQIIANLAGEGKLDEYDEETLYIVINKLIGLIEEYEVLDIVLYAVYMLITKLVPIADELAPRFQANGLTLNDLIDSVDDEELFMENIKLLLKDPNETEIPGTATDMDAISSLLERLKAFFEKIRIFFEKLFTF